MIGRSIIQHSVALAGFAAICAFVLALTHSETEAPITKAKAKARAQALAAVMPPSLYRDPILDERFVVSGDNSTAFIAPGTKILRARSNTQVTGIIVPIQTPEGYSGDIDLLVGMDNTLTITGVRVVTHKETPGLGDKIQRNKSPWIDSFIDKSLSNTSESTWAVKRDGGAFDQFTGATITPRAVVAAVYGALVYARDNYQTLFEAPLPEALLDISFTEHQQTNIISQLGYWEKRVDGTFYAE